MKRPPFTSVRSYLLLAGGLAGIGWEIVVESGDRPTIIVACLLMMGISVPLHLDEKAKAVLTTLIHTDPEEKP